MRPVVVDWETEPIDDRKAHLAPRPVGVGVYEPGRRPVYLAWGHPTGNNTTWQEGKRRVRDLWRSGRKLLFHGAEFELSVAQQHCDLHWLPPERYECTRLGLFLHDPDSKRVDLKEASERLLGMEPEERDELKEWILANFLEAKKSTWGEWICKAPARLAGRYCKADLRMTLGIYNYLKPDLVEMARAYEREKKILHVANKASHTGIPIDVPAVAQFVEDAPGMGKRIDTAIRRRLGAPGLDLTKKEQVCDAMEEAGIIEEWLLTPKAEKRSMAHKDLAHTCLDRHFIHLWHSRSLLHTYVSTFAKNWLEMEIDGWVHPRWNTVATESGGGARTGRLSSNPNVQNISKKEPLRALPSLVLPDLRSMVRAGEGLLLVGSDYGQQEFRLLFHFDNGDMARRYREDPTIHAHKMGQALIAQKGISLTYDETKGAGFAVIYGQGAASTAVGLGCDIPRAREILRAYRAAFPGIAEVDHELRSLAKRGEPFYTWGGRRYYCEEPLYDADGTRVRSFEYKLINTKIQGSAADHLKEAMIAYDEHPGRRGRLCLNAHDELLAVAGEREAKAEARVLEDAMMSVGPFNVPMLAEAAVGKTWREAKA